jgi:DNA-binding SARP family transcriptional activator/WD40 repeat protein
LQRRWSPVEARLKRYRLGFRRACHGRINVAMWFGVLGPFEVRDAAGEVVHVGGSVRRELLAALLCRAGESVPAAELIDDVWGEAPPRTAGKTLQSHFVRLRQDLARSGDAVIVTEGAGYRLDVSALTLDAACFEAELNEGLAAFRRGDDRLAIKHIDAALAMWRGEAYLDFTRATFALNERVRLADLRAVALETRTDAALRLGEAATLIGELENRIRRAPYRERTWEQLILALYRSGRQADALAAYRMVRQRLTHELGVDPGPALSALEQRMLNQDPTLLADPGAAPLPDGHDAVVGQCPYRGLAGYGADDAGLFVGRERLTALLAGRLADARVVVVAGASGSGKSSVVRAGLVPALRAGALPQSAAWRVVVTTPASRAGTDSAADVFVLDQAEELFTVLDESDRIDLLERLRGFVGDGSRLVVVLRGDFFATLAEVPWLARYAQRDPVLVGRMREDELARVIVEPARRTGVTVADEVVDTILNESAGQAQPLPLVAVALVRAWEERDGDVITREAYEASGGLVGAIEATAEATYARLSDASKAEARRLLVRMAVREGASWTRKPLQREAMSVGAGRTVLDALAEGRLITVTEGRVELSHDALLERWPRLRRWLDDRVMAAGLLEHLAVATQAWLAGGRQDTDLHRGPRLRASLDWRETHPEDLSADESDFLTASAAAEEALQVTALRSARRTARRLRLLVAGLAVALLAAVAGGVIAIQQRTAARNQALQADAVRLAALARALPGDQRDVALLLGAQGYLLHPSDQTAGGLQTALMATPPGLDRIIRYHSPATLPHLDSTGRLLAVPGQDGTVAVYDLATGGVRTFTSAAPRQFAVFSGDDRFVAAGGQNGSVVIWDANTGARSGSPLPVGGGVVHPVFDPRNDNLLFVVDSRGVVSEWDRSDPDHPRRVRYLEGFQAGGLITEAPNLTISPDGRRLAAGDMQTSYVGGSPCVWDTRTGHKVQTAFGAIGAFAADSQTLPLGFGDGTVLWNGRTGRAEYTVPDTGGLPLAVVSPDGDRIAVPQSLHGTGVVSVYNVRTHRQLGQPLKLHGGPAEPVGFLPDGRLVTSGTNDAAIWTPGLDVSPLGAQLDTSSDPITDPGNGDEYPIFLSRSRSVVTVGGSNVPVVHDLVTGQALGPLLSGAVSGPVATDPSGRLLGGGRTAGGGAGIWDLRSGQLLSTLPGSTGVAWTPPVWSPTGDRVVINFDGVIDLWHVADPSHLVVPDQIGDQLGAAGEAAFTPDGRGLVILTIDGTIASIDVDTGRIEWRRAAREGAAGDIAVSPNGSTIAFSYYDGAIGHLQLLDSATGIPRTSTALSITGGFGFVNGGRWLVASQYGTVPQTQLYDASTLEPIGTPFPTTTHRRGNTPTAPTSVDASGTMFAEATSADPVVWNVDPASWLRLACSIAGRNLTAAEWQHYLPHRGYQRTCPQYPAP